MLKFYSHFIIIAVGRASFHFVGGSIPYHYGKMSNNRLFSWLFNGTFDIEMQNFHQIQSYLGYLRNDNMEFHIKIQETIRRILLWRICLMWHPLVDKYFVIFEAWLIQREIWLMRSKNHRISFHAALTIQCAENTISNFMAETKTAAYWSCIGPEANVVLTLYCYQIVSVPFFAFLRPLFNNVVLVFDPKLEQSIF